MLKHYDLTYLQILLIQGMETRMNNTTLTLPSKMQIKVAVKAIATAMLFFVIYIAQN